MQGTFVAMFAMFVLKSWGFYQIFLSRTLCRGPNKSPIKKKSKVIGDKASSIDLSLLVFVLFKWRQFQRDATLSYCQLLIGRKKPKKCRRLY